MDFIENIRVRQERAEAGFRAEIDRPAAVYGTREVCRIGVAKDPPAEGDEARMALLFKERRLHQFRARERSLRLLNFRDEDFEWIDYQSLGRFGCL